MVHFKVCCSMLIFSFCPLVSSLRFLFSFFLHQLWSNGVESLRLRPPSLTDHRIYHRPRNPVAGYGAHSDFQKSTIGYGVPRYGIYDFVAGVHGGSFNPTTTPRSGTHDRSPISCLCYCVFLSKFSNLRLMRINDSESKSFSYILLLFLD